ncbi:hypothetical protein [Bacteroides thetaiotaomicron]|nr:hypothetical protein [Bacteroides thetaiotaomicron]MCS2487296.1 hypothetical protein [Bacteroides thetaiotaomicron]
MHRFSANFALLTRQDGQIETNLAVSIRDAVRSDYLEYWTANIYTD